MINGPTRNHRVAVPAGLHDQTKRRGHRLGVSIITQPHADTVEVDEFIEFIVLLLCRRGAAHPRALRKLSRMAAFYAALTEDRIGARSEKGHKAPLFVTL
jgi:hypothetical protein